MSLLEREQCLADMAGWLSSVAERGGCIVLVGGEAGIGKTSLLQAFSKRNPQHRFLWGACGALYTPQPLAPLLDMARQTAGALAAAVHSDASRDVTFRAALAELDQPNTVVVFEDKHWADEATLDLSRAGHFARMR
jgi:predicted ATPase